MYVLIIALLVIFTICMLLKFIKNMNHNKSGEPNKIAFVTGYIGTAPTNIPNLDLKSRKNIDSYFITNNETVAKEARKSSSYTDVIMLDIPVLDAKNSVKNFISNTMYGKKLKVYPQKFLNKKYNFVVWYDNKFDVNDKDTIDVINKWNPNKAMMLHKHPFLNNVAEELKESMRQARYRREKQKYKDYIEKCKEEGLSDKYHLHSQCGFLIYNMDNEYTKKIQDDWMKNIKKCGIQDQISFNMLRQNHEDYLDEFKHKISNNMI